VALVAELDWFEDQAARRGINLEQPALPPTLGYRELLGRLDATPFEAAVTALWALERVYLLAWAFAASATSPFVAPSQAKRHVPKSTEPQEARATASASPRPVR